MQNDPELRAYEARLRLLEERLSDIRLSRRVLMDMLDHARAEKLLLEKENQRLKKQNGILSRKLWQSRIRSGENAPETE